MVSGFKEKYSKNWPKYTNIPIIPLKIIAPRF